MTVAPQSPPVRETPRAAPLSLTSAAASVTAFVDVAVVPMDTERLLEHQTVVVEGSRITALGPTKQVQMPPGAQRVDGQGKVLIPGLADCHAHFATAVANLATPSERLAGWEQQLFLLLAHGLTTLRIMDHHNYFRSEELLQLRARAAAGAMLSPRIYTSGFIKDRLPDSVRWTPLLLNEVAEAVTSYKAAGFDFIKVHQGTVRPPGESSAVFDSLVAVARRVGLPIGGHAVVPLERALATYRVIDHEIWWDNLDSQKPLAELMPQIRELAAATQRAGVWNCPTLQNTILNYTVRSRIPEQEREQILGVSRQVVKALQEASAGLLAGSDGLQAPRDISSELAALPPVQRQMEAFYGYAGATHRELQALVEAGLTPYQALVAATRNMAAYLGALDTTGTIAVGKQADLVLLEGNPLADIRHTERIAGVMLHGQWLDRAALDKRTAEIGAALCERDPAEAEEPQPCK